MIKNQRQLAPLTKENIEQLQREFKCNKANDQVSKTEVYHNQTRKGTIARSDGDGESVDVTTNNIEQRRTSSVFYEHKRVLSSGLSVNEETKPANKNKQFDQNSYDQENDREKKVYDGEALGTDINSENHDESNKGLNRTPIHKNDGKSLESLSGKGEKEEVEEDDEKEEERKEKKEETKDQEDEKEEEDEEEEEVEEKDEEIDFEENNNSTSSKKPDNYIAYDSADEVHYNTDDLNEEYDSADEFREFEKQLRENMENAESPTESESEEDPTPDTTSKDIDGDTETLATSRLSSSLLPANELDSDDDDDDDDDFTSEEEQPEEEDEEVDYEYMTSPMESEPATDDEQSEEESVQSALTQEEEENPITEPIEIIPTEEKYNENDAEEEVVTHEDTEFLQDEAATTNENLETRPETRLVSGQSASPHIELESAFGSDQFDEFEGRIFDHGECNFNTPLLFVENDELEVNSRNGYIAKSKSKLPRKAKKKRKRRRKELAKLTFTKYPLSDSEEESINNELKETKRTKKLKKRHMSDKSETGSVEPLDTALSCSSGSEWNISSSEMSVSSSHNSTSTISESSYIESEYLSSHLSPRPVTRKTCWPIDGKLRNLPPITKKIQSDPQQQAINKPKKAKKSLSASTRPPKTDDNSTMVKKILSANRNKITKLYNVVEELQQEVDTLRQENRTLKRISVKQERELKRVDREEGSLPQLLQRHSAELRTYRQRLKKNKQEIIQKEKESHSHDVELTKLRDKLQHFKQLDNNKKLEERATLAKKLEKVEKALSERDTKILELQKTIKLSEKARQREIKEHQDRYKKAKDELVQVQENVLSLREKLKEKEKQLDMTNIYHQNIQRKLKKVNPLALPPAYVNTNTDILLTDQKKRTNVFLTNGVSDTGSNISAEPLKSEEKSLFEVSSEKGKKESLSIVDKNLEYEKQQAEQLKEKLEREERKRKQEEEKRKEEEARKHEEEQKRIREEEALKDKIRQLEEEKRKKEQQELIEIERKKREEEERLRKAKEEEAHLKFKEDEEIRRKKDLLLARMKAIDAGQEKPNGIISMDINPKAQDNKPKKLPIFLQSSEKHTTTKEPSNEPTIFTEKEKQKFGSSTSIHSKHSKDSSYDVKESFQNLHHGLPAHPSDQHFRGRRNSQDDDVAFGSYKPSVGQRKEANSKTETFGSYNPSFGEPSNRKSSGLHFGKRQENKQDKSDDVVFGSYQPTFSGNSKSSTVPSKDNDSAGALDFSSKRSDGRRKKPSQPNSIFGEDLFDNNKPKQTSIFDDDSFNRSSNKPKDKNYPWETKVSASNDIDDESLLPRRPKLNQGFNHGPKQQIPAVGNILNGTLEDDIEEVTL